ncbi:multidrug effflux MFS transporter [Saccharothrix sp. HUAS TT1]|uniref:multidrug effflux MFS transporter n=1 Tax=unclassified Saccharothrix TaxID=2593673 RepID=UPI00345B7682
MSGNVGLIIILGALTALGPLSNDAYLPSWPQLAADLSATPSAVQLSLTACLVGLGVGQMIAGPLSDRFGRRGPLLVGLLLYTVTSVLCAFAPSIWLLIVLRLLQGFGGATGIVIAAAIVRDRHVGAAAAKYFSMLLLVTGLAPVLAPVIGGQLLRFTTWPGIFIALAAAGGLMVVAVALGLRETLPPERRDAGGLKSILPTFGRLLSDRVFVGYGLACGFGFGAMFAYIAGSPFVLQEIHGLSPQAYSAVFAVNAFGLVIAAQVSGRIVHRVNPRALLGAGVAASAAGGLVVLAAVLADLGLVALLIGLFVVVASVGLIMPNSMALALNDHGAVAGSAAALIGLVQHLLGAVAAPFAGVAGAVNALPMAVTITVLGVAALLSFAVLARKRKDVPVDSAAPVALAGQD